MKRRETREERVLAHSLWCALYARHLSLGFVMMITWVILTWDMHQCGTFRSNMKGRGEAVELMLAQRPALMVGDECDSRSRGEENKLCELWNERVSRCQWVINKPLSFHMGRWSRRYTTQSQTVLGDKHQENTGSAPDISSVSVSVWHSVLSRTLIPL